MKKKTLRARLGREVRGATGLPFPLAMRAGKLVHRRDHDGLAALLGSAAEVTCSPCGCNDPTCFHEQVVIHGPKGLWGG